MPRSLNILVIEDSRPDFMLLERHLSNSGLNCRLRRVDSQEALDSALGTAGVDVVLADYNVPGMPFEDTVSRITSHNPELPIILVSSIVGEEKAIDLLKHGLADFVLKDRLARLRPAIERALAESRVRKARMEAEISYHGLFESISDCLCIIGESGHIIDINLAAVAMYGYPRDFFIGKTPSIEIPPGRDDLVAAQEALIRRALAGESAHYESLAQRANGEIFPQLVSLSCGVYKGRRAVFRLVRDISKMKETEQRLRASEAWVSSIIDTVPEAILVVNQQGRIERVNMCAEQIFGYERDELLGQVVERLIPPRFQADHSMWRDKFASEDSWRKMGESMDLFALHKEGYEIPVEVGLASLEYDDQKYVIASIADMRSRKAAEQALRHSEERLRLMTDSIKDYAIIMLDPDGRVASWNEGAVRLKGYPGNEVLGKGMAMFYPPEDIAADKPAALLQQARDKGRVEDEGWRIRKDGSRFYANVVISTVFDARGTLLGFSKITRDITGQRAADIRIRNEREQQETLRSLLEITLSGASQEQALSQCLDRIFAMSWLKLMPKGGIFLADSAGQTLHLFVSKNLSNEIQSLCAQVPWGRCHCGKAAMHGTLQYAHCVDARHEITYPGIPDHGHYSLPLISNGELLGVLVLYLTTNFQRDALKEQFLASVADILSGYISRVCAEQQIIKQNENLEQQVAERTEDLEKARLEAERLARVKDNFLATMSHEIRTPMNALLGMLELVGVRGLSGEQTRMLDVATESGKSLLRIIDDILDYSKIEAGKLAILAEPTSVAEVMQLTASFYTQLASSKGLLLQCEVSPEISPVVSVDRLRLRQILNNFLSNAIKFTDAGHIELKAELVEHLPGAERVRFVASDTGVGIEQEAQKSLFQPFSQVDADTTRRFGGTGLGLAICRRLASMMGGEISLASQPGQGTTLSLTLDLPILEPTLLQTATSEPRGVVAPTYSASAPTAEAALATGRLILLVDDHPTNREVLTQQLEMLGYASEQASGSVEALEMWKDRNYGLLITDCHMPEMDGYQLTREIRRLEVETGRKRIPILGWTANAMQDALKECGAAGMDDMLVKPANLNKLREKLDQLLAQSPQPELSGQPADTDGSDSVELKDILDYTVLGELTGGEPAMEQRILARYQRSNRPDAEALEQALANGDLVAIGHLAHRMKGAARMIGARDFAKACEALELSARAGDAGQVAAAHEPYLAAYRQLNEALGRT